ncbi:MAG: M28 family peptidase [Candidatus Eisenbacteria bacterium]|nr:M28 family peptidase [Candidatus Eisenbacteria bacterium]
MPVLLALLVLPGACAARYEVDGPRALARVRRQVEAGPRIPGSPGHAAVLSWLTAELARLGGRVESRSFADTVDGRPLALTNVIARFGPAAASGSSGRRIVLCAHWDSRPWSDQDPDPARRGDPVPGANDGGSGVAVLLEVAELMHRRPPRVEVDLVFFDGEDQGRASRPEEFCLGARAYAARLAASPAETRPAAAFLFDMVGDRDLEIHPEVNSARRAANLVELVLEGARATGARHFRPDPRWELTDDHVPLLDAGIPAVDIVDFDFPAWHTRRDRPDQVSAESLAEVARVAAWLVYASPLAAAP